MHADRLTNRQTDPNSLLSHSPKGARVIATTFLSYKRRQTNRHTDKQTKTHYPRTSLLELHKLRRHHPDQHITLTFYGGAVHAANVLRARVLPVHQSPHEAAPLIDLVDVTHVLARHLVRHTDPVQHACHRDRRGVVERSRDIVRLREVIDRLIVLALLPRQRCSNEK